MSDHRSRRRHLGARAAQRRARPPDPREAARRHDPAPDVHAAVRVRLRRRDRVPDGNYHEYLVGGILVQTLAFGMMGPGVSIATDLREGMVDRLRTLPDRPLGLPARPRARRVGGDAAGARRPRAQRPGRRLADPRRRPEARRRLRAARAVRHGDAVARHRDRRQRPLARRRPGDRVPRRVPADVHLQRLRADGRVAVPAADDRGVEPDLGARRRDADPVRQPGRAPRRRALAARAPGRRRRCCGAWRSSRSPSRSP